MQPIWPRTSPPPVNWLGRFPTRAALGSLGTLVTMTRWPSPSTAALWMPALRAATRIVRPTAGAMAKMWRYC